MGESGEKGKIGETGKFWYINSSIKLNMKKSDKFEDLYVWKDSVALAKEIFQLFNEVRVFSIRNQIERAAVSISTNIAEGYEYGSDKQFVRFLYIAKGSCGEVRSLLLLSKELSIFNNIQVEILVEKCSKLSIMIYKLIKVRTNGKAG